MHHIQISVLSNINKIMPVAYETFGYLRRPQRHFISTGKITALLGETTSVHSISSRRKHFLSLTKMNALCMTQVGRGTIGQCSFPFPQTGHSPGLGICLASLNLSWTNSGARRRATDAFASSPNQGLLGGQQGWLWWGWEQGGCPQACLAAQLASPHWPANQLGGGEYNLEAYGAGIALPTLPQTKDCLVREIGWVVCSSASFPSQICLQEGRGEAEKAPHPSPRPLIWGSMWSFSQILYSLQEIGVELPLLPIPSPDMSTTINECLFMAIIMGLPELHFKNNLFVIKLIANLETTNSLACLK